ncbi:MAG: hypothetical protein Q9159_000712 [Coniocarpon cinnabarinum]
MTTVKGGQWTNIEDEILKASVSKYGLNQWARVSSLLARKSAKQCKARWQEWLDPAIRKVEWSKEEDEKLLHLAKLMPTQWRTLAPMVGRTAQQCLQRYQKLLDDAEKRENDDLGLMGPEGGESQAPSADDVRRLRPGEEDPDPENKPALPDTIDMDEDEKEMLSEARARLANTKGKKAKRKARERQLEESRRLALLQKRRELKNAGINIKINNRKPGQMDYNADIPFEKAPAPGFYDTQDEQTVNEREREAFDPRKKQLANKRKQDDQEQNEDDDNRKRRKGDKSSSNAFAAAAKAGQIHKIREAERQSKRRALNLPAPQVGESELESIVKMGMAGQGSADDSMSGDYSRDGVIDATPLRTPQVQKEEDRIANEVRNARLRTETQSALLGGDNPDLDDADSTTTTGYEGATPSKNVAATPNPLATPLRQADINATPRGPGATPLRTPRDSFKLNQTPQSSVASTPRDLKLAQRDSRSAFAAKLGALPKPKATDFELELPEEQAETAPLSAAVKEEDAAVRDARFAAIREEQARKERLRQTQVIQRNLPRPAFVDAKRMLDSIGDVGDSAEMAIVRESVVLMAHDARKFRGQENIAEAGAMPQLDRFTDKELADARAEIALESSMVPHRDENLQALVSAWEDLHGNDAVDQFVDHVTEAELSAHFEVVEENMTNMAVSANEIEKKLAKTLGGYQARSKLLRGKVGEAAEALEKARIEVEVKRAAQVAEDAAVDERLERLREDVRVVMRRERAGQEEFRGLKEELEALRVGEV